MKYSCECCGYNTNIKRDYDKHNLTPKHLKNKENNKTIEQINAELIFECKKCNKKYKSNNGLWNHKKTCIEEPKKVEQTPQQTTTILTEENAKTFFENNKDFFINMVIDELKNNCGILENRLIPYNSSNELVKYDENNLKNEVIQIKQELKQELKQEIQLVNKKAEIANEITNRRIDRLERKFMEYTDNYCKDNIDYNVFVDELEITYKFCKDFSEDFFTPITELIKKALKNVGLENSPIYYVFNKEEKVIVRVKNEIWKTYYYDDMKVSGVISEIIEPLINKIRTGLDKLSDEKLTRKNGYQHFYAKLDDQLHGQKPILDYGLYEPIFLDTRKIKRLINKKQGNTKDKVEELNDDANDVEDDDEDDDDDDEDEDDE